MSILWVLLMLLLLQIIFSSSSADNNIILPFSRRQSNNNNNNKNPWEILKRQAVASRHRAQRRFSVNVPLSPRSYDEYTVPLSFGTPPQTLRFTVDTGRSLTWFPCTLPWGQKYKCSNCDFPGVDPAHYPAFDPNKSSSSKIIPCQSTQCRWLSPESHCSNSKNHTTSCGYTYHYGIGNTTGLLLNETLALGNTTVFNFTAGCSVSSADLQEGVVGFGRDPESLPAQMGLTSFSHCMVSHNLDDNPAATGDLILSRDKGGGGQFNYTPFLTNPRDYSDYYYVRLESISVGRVSLKVPSKYLEPDANTGHGGTVVDSGTPFTMMKKPVFDLVFQEFQRQVGNKYKRNKRAENQTGVKPCYGSGTELPQLTFTFKGGVEMVLPLPNYFAYADRKGSVLCMTIVTLEDELGLSPAIILGNYLQQDYYIKYDLENNQLGIRQQKCN